MNNAFQNVFLFYLSIYWLLLLGVRSPARRVSDSSSESISVFHAFCIIIKFIVCIIGYLNWKHRSCDNDVCDCEKLQTLCNVMWVWIPFAWPLNFFFILSYYLSLYLWFEIYHFEICLKKQQHPKLYMFEKHVPLISNKCSETLPWTSDQWISQYS